MRLNSLSRRALRALQSFNPKRPRSEYLTTPNGSVEIRTDAWGVPHIYARHADDLFFGQGYVTARDRLFQMDYSRHAAAGRLCELVGNRPVPWRDLTVHIKDRTTLDIDIMLRTFGLEHGARASYAAHSPEARQVLAAYTAGVNAWIVQGHRPLEHRLLNTQVRPWAEVDSLLMFKGIAFELNFGWRAILLGHMFDTAGLSDATARTLWPFARPDDSPIIEAGWRPALRELAGTRDAATEALSLGNAPGVGSNSFAVSAERSVTGKPLLANDTHLLMTAPTPWYEIGLHGGGYDVHGFALAGVPALGIGQTPHQAWGITAGMVQDLDLFAEKIDPADPTRYAIPGGWASLQSRNEVIAIRGKKAHALTVQSTRHGPLLHTKAPTPDNQGLAVCWTGHEAGRELDALLTLATAQDLEACVQAAQFQTCPTYNITYVNRDGRIAYVLAGTIPKRRRDTPLRPLEGWTGQWDWQGNVSWEDNPRCIDPESGIIVTANNRIRGVDTSHGANASHHLGDLFEPSWRFDRITQLLKETTQIDAQGMAAIQVDTHSAFGLAAREAIFKLLGERITTEDATAEEQRCIATYVKLWRAWDGNTARKSAAPVIALPLPYAIAREVVRRLAGDDAAWGYVEMGSMVSPSILAMLARAETLHIEHGIDLALVARQTLLEHVRKTIAHQGTDPTAWCWGKAHQLTMRHRMHGSPVGAFFSTGPQPAPGGPDTVCRGDFDSGQSYNMRVGAAVRLVFEAGNMDTARTILPGGQSGDRLSPHYDDQMQRFLDGELKDSPGHR